MTQDIATPSNASIDDGQQTIAERHTPGDVVAQQPSRLDPNLVFFRVRREPLDPLGGSLATAPAEMES